MSRSFRSRTSRAARLAVPVLMALYLAVLVPAEAGAGTPGAVVLLGSLAGVVQGAALYRRRSHPVPVLAVCLVGGLVIQLIAPNGIFPWAGLVVLGSLASTRPPSVSLPALAALLALTSLNFRTAPQEEAQFAMAVPVVVWALAEAVRNRRAAVAEASHRAVTEEQARIARELHDVIAHSVSVVVVQAAAADDVFDERPDQARSALRAIESSGRATLAELRRLLAVVRPEPDERSPQPGLDRLGELAEPLRAAGLPVSLTVRVPGPLPAGVEVSAYRIVQEALTNVLRHARARRVEVTARADGDVLEVEVTDDGAGAGVHAGARGGFGLVGMRERAAVLGGTVAAGPRPGGAGFRVHARLPLRAPTPSEGGRP
ncbi:sensor histidine kinase [Streptomyces johnsoniae]|uniref:histidine kinase n=1 Tax=Streptomyces johnsoniae TaxID=3075532 RepID=A0ABU2S499_9ACTN|nr:histidine kinase [Streptomyces sp. DSM 41886]MDT0443807.1 histidine kinase [Streptomyces sp. DSM 41886]